MSKETLTEQVDNEEDELRPEYDLSQLLKGGIRGKYTERYKAGTNLVLLEPDVAQAFPDDEAVNEALRLVMQISKLHIQADASSPVQSEAYLG